jgi:beta-xylosidase
MKNYFLLLLALLLPALSQATAQNPFLTHLYTADPSARVFDNTLYLYPSHDLDTATWFSMVDYHVFSTNNMSHWTDHGVALSIADIAWAKECAWAPDCVRKNGKYYFYFPTDKFHIGVAVGDTPWGPFRDPIGRPLLSKDTPGVVCNRDFIDPAILIDDDGSAYMFMGQNAVNVIRLNDDMVSFDGRVHIIEGADDFFEAAWIHKYKGKYYLSYSGRGKILYAMADNVYGPYHFQGAILEEMNSITNHHSIVEYRGQWYLFYHNSDLYFSKHAGDDGSKEWKGVHPFRRSVCVDYLYYNEDGTIRPVIPTKEGVGRIDE